MKNYKYIGKTSKESFIIKGINVFGEKWTNAGSCVTVINPLDNKTYTFSKYISGGVEFAAGKDSQGYWLFFSEK